MTTHQPGDVTTITGTLTTPIPAGPFCLFARAVATISPTARFRGAGETAMAFTAPIPRALCDLQLPDEQASHDRVAAAASYWTGQLSWVPDITPEEAALDAVTAVLTRLDHVAPWLLPQMMDAAVTGEKQ